MFRKVTFGLVVLVLPSASRLTSSSLPVPEHPKRNCIDNSIIEFGKAIDCGGDTIQLIRKKGLQVFIAEFKNESNEITK